VTDPRLSTKPEVGDPGPLGLFEGFGVEIEWMIVDSESLDIRPSGDRLLGEGGEVERGAMAWSNELVLHVVEAKTNGPAPTLDGLAEAFHAEVMEAERRLEPLGCQLLSGGAHPWMEPARDTRIWPHEYTEVYRAFDRIFGVQGHGWSNLQSTHLNLPFSGDEEFAALHQAIRLILPFVPALSAASPVLDGVVQPNLDERMDRYRMNAARIPSVSGGVMPDRSSSRRAYETEVLAPLYRDLAPHDPEGTLRHEWVNARGAIPRFERGAIEIRVIDAQESPIMDLAILKLVVAMIRRITAAGLALADPAGRSPLDGVSTEVLREMLADTVRDAERASLSGTRRREAMAPLLDVLQVADLHPRDAGAFWAAGAEVTGENSAELRTLLDQGPLARRILGALGTRGGRELRPGDAPGEAVLRSTWRGVGEALRANRPFVP